MDGIKGEGALSADELLSARERIEAVINNIEQVIAGKKEVVELVVLALLSEGHVLIEDVPGVGKTTLVSSLAKSIEGEFKRIQFTPDTMPSDITGFSIYNQKTGDFEFRTGAAMSNIVLADEINRTSAKTQASLLEIMEEKQVTVDSHTYKMKRPYMVLATQNPIEYLGTYPLPEAQIDRFMIKLSVGYPSFADEMHFVQHGKKAKQKLSSVMNAAEVIRLIGLAEKVEVSDMVNRYIVGIVTATRTHPDLLLGSSPRGSIALHGIARAYALYQGRSYVIPDDVKYLAPYVLGHRIQLNHEAKTKKLKTRDVIGAILQEIIVPISPSAAK